MPNPDQSSQAVEVTARLLREWPLPAAAESKYARGQVLVMGGALRSPGAAMLAGLAALRAGAGRLTLAVGESVAAHVGTAILETGIVPLPETRDGHIIGTEIAVAADDIADADVLLLGPGLDDADQTSYLLRTLRPLLSDTTIVALDAYALGALPDVPDFSADLRGRLILTPNSAEASRLLDRESEGGVAEAREIAKRYGAVVSFSGLVASPDGRAWEVTSGGPGLATSGSGDVLAGTIAGLAGRGAAPEQAAVWATYVHAAVGDRLTASAAPIGYLARELLAEIPVLLAEVAGR
jgi:ADP-dependent NAD(P)H-hydrate dehydratase